MKRFHPFFLFFFFFLSRIETLQDKNMQTRSQSQSKCKSNIKVVIRIRPESSVEQADKYVNVTEAISDHMLVFDPKSSVNSGFLLQKRRNFTQRRFKDLKYAFDYVFKPSATNKEIFEHTTDGVISDVLKGYNCSGKHMTSCF